MAVVVDQLSAGPGRPRATVAERAATLSAKETQLATKDAEMRCRDVVVEKLAGLR